MAIVRVSATAPAAIAAALPATDRAVARVVMDLAPAPAVRVVMVLAAPVAMIVAPVVMTAVLRVTMTPRPSVR